jgi:hypothetical protein
MRTLGTAAAAVLLTALLGLTGLSIVAQASDMETSVDVQVRYRGEMDRKELDSDLGFDSFHLLRTRVGLTALMGKGTKARFLVQDSRTLGRPFSGTTTRDANLGVHEAFMEVQNFVFEDVTLRAGRFPMVYGNERIIGAVGWSNVGRTFDAVRARLQVDGWAFDAFWAMLVEARQNSHVDKDLFGLYASSSDLNADIFLLHDLDGRRLETGEKILKRWTAGAYSQRKFAENFDYIANAAFQFGSTIGQSIAAYLAAVELGFTVPSDVKYRIAGGVDWASGDDDLTDDDFKAFNNEYYTGHKFRGFMDLFVSSDIEGLIDLYLRNKLKLESGWILGGDIHYFQTAQDYMSVVDGTETSSVGVEVDLTARTPAIGKAAVQLGASAFFPAEDFAGEDADPGLWGYVMVTVKGR